MTSKSLFWAQTFILKQNQAIKKTPPSNHQDFSQMTSERLLWAQAIIFNENLPILYCPSNHHYFFQMTSTSLFSRQAIIFNEIDRSYLRKSSLFQIVRLFSLQTIIFNEYQPFQKQPQIIIISFTRSNDTSVFKTSHHFQTKSTDFIPPLKSAGFLSNDLLKPWISFKWRLQASFLHKPSFSTKINRFWNLPEIIRISLKWPSQACF